MKNLFSIFVMLVFATSMVAQGNARTTEQKVAKVTFEKTKVSYGTIAQGSDPYRVFKGTNNSNEPLIIKNAKGSCGCTVPEWPKKPIKPGADFEVKVRYDTNRVGAINKSVRLYHNLDDQPVVLFITGKVEQKKAPVSTPTKKTNGNTLSPKPSTNQ